MAMNGLHEAPYWWDEAPPSERTGELPASVDAVVVGGGFTGLSAALTLAKGGRSVLLVDAGRIGHGASTRNGGHVGAKLRRGIPSIEAEHGQAVADAVWTVGREARAYIEALVSEEKISCDFAGAPRFYGAHKPKDYDTIARSAELLNRRIGLDIEAVPRDRQSRYIDSDAYHGGLIDRSCAGFHPGKFIRGMLERAEAAGAKVLSNTAVEGVERVGPGQVKVRTSKGDVLARDVVVGTNGYTGAAFPDLQRRIIPIGSYLIATEPLPADVIGSLMPGCDLVIDSRRCASYMRISPDRRRILYGGRVAATDISPQTSAPRLKAVLDQIFPRLRSASVTHAWMGFTGFTFDELPHIGSQDGIHYAMGYCGSGTAMATFLGHKVGEKILGRPEGATALDALPFQTKNYYRGSPWFLSTVIATFRILDRFRL